VFILEHDRGGGVGRVGPQMHFGFRVQAGADAEAMG
jgi:hypothetical protein